MIGTRYIQLYIQLINSKLPGSESDLTAATCTMASHAVALWWFPISPWQHRDTQTPPVQEGSRPFPPDSTPQAVFFPCFLCDPGTVRTAML